jgi:hypothetical protein
MCDGAARDPLDEARRRVRQPGHHGEPGGEFARHHRDLLELGRGPGGSTGSREPAAAASHKCVPNCVQTRRTSLKPGVTEQITQCS